MTSTMEPNHSAVLNKVMDISIEERPAPTAPGPNDVTIRVGSVGICGSDVHYWTHGAIGDFIVKAPMVLGHESAGTVIAVGSNVTTLKEGDRVAMEPGVPCRKCTYCRTGEYNLCPDIEFFATPPVDGSLARYINHPADYSFKLPDSVSMEEGAMCEPLSVGVYACERAGVKAGCRVAIYGAGPIGLVTLLVARAYGADHITITDINADRLKVAKELGADFTYLIEKGCDAAGDIKKEVGQVDFSIECTGIESSVQTAIFVTRSGGTVCLVGLCHTEMKLPIVNASTRQVDIKGIFRYRNTYPTCISLLSQKRVDVKPLITHRFELNQVVDAFEVARTGNGGAIKVMFNL